MRNNELELKARYVKVYPQVKQINLVKKQLQKLDKLFDDKSQKWSFTNQAQITRQITRYAKQYGVHVRSVKFNDEGKLQEITIRPIKIIVDGEYENLKTLLLILTKHFLLLDYHLTKEKHDYVAEIKLGLLS